MFAFTLETRCRHSKLCACWILPEHYCSKVQSIDVLIESYILCDIIIDLKQMMNQGDSSDCHCNTWLTARRSMNVLMCLIKYYVTWLKMNNNYFGAELHFKQLLARIYKGICLPSEQIFFKIFILKEYMVILLQSSKRWFFRGCWDYHCNFD